MRKSFWVLALLAMFAFALTAKAQDETPKAELFAGYDYIRLNSASTSSNFNGGSGQFTYNLNNWLGVVGLHPQWLRRGNFLLPVRAAD